MYVSWPFCCKLAPFICYLLNCGLGNAESCPGCCYSDAWETRARHEVFRGNFLPNWCLNSMWFWLFFIKTFEIWSSGRMKQCFPNCSALSVIAFVRTSVSFSGATHLHWLVSFLAADGWATEKALADLPEALCFLSDCSNFDSSLGALWQKNSLQMSIPFFLLRTLAKTTCKCMHVCARVHVCMCVCVVYNCVCTVPICACDSQRTVDVFLYPYLTYSFEMGSLMEFGASHNPLVSALPLPERGYKYLSRPVILRGYRDPNSVPHAFIANDLTQWTISSDCPRYLLNEASYTNGKLLCSLLSFVQNVFPFQCWRFILVFLLSHPSTS